MPKLKSTEEQAIDIAIGKRIRLLRTRRKVSQTVLADHIGVTYQQLQKCESGANRVGGGRLWRIADFLRVPVSYFFEDVAASALPDFDPAARNLQEIAASPLGTRILEALGAIEDQTLKKRLADLVEGLAAAAKTKQKP